MRKLIPYLLLFLPILTFAQVEVETKSDSTGRAEIVSIDPTYKLDTIDYLTQKNPMRASLYSAILPGMGQLYNKKWWKAPLVWGVLGTGVGFIVHYNNQYKEYRGYYMDKLYGYPLENPTLQNMSLENLATIQDDRKRTRDYAIALTALAYILNIVDASVDAHLFGIKKDPDLSFQPTVMENINSYELALGFGVNYKF
jgi:hypothetical protein